MFLGCAQLPQTTCSSDIEGLLLLLFSVLEKLHFSGKSPSTEFLFWPQNFISK